MAVLQLRLAVELGPGPSPNDGRNLDTAAPPRKRQTSEMCRPLSLCSSCEAGVPPGRMTREFGAMVVVVVVATAARGDDGEEDTSVAAE
jgi:hypothetical protein